MARPGGHEGKIKAPATTRNSDQGRKETGRMKGFATFKESVREKGGIWASNNVYFTQYRDGYSASYIPHWPEHSPEDCAISYNWITDKWTYRTPEIYDAEYNRIK